MSLLINIMGVAAIGFAGTTVSLSPGQAILYGIGVLLFGSYLLCFWINVIWFSIFNFIRRCGAQTLPEYLEMRYDGRVRNVVAFGHNYRIMWNPCK